MKTKVINKNYGSIPHLSTSKMHQQADKKIELGQEKILTEKARDWKDLIIVTEKLDGSNVGIYRSDSGEIIPITRSGYRAIDSPYKQHHLFHKWVMNRCYVFNNILFPSWRICGEWMIQQHGTRYNIIFNSPFVAFDLIDANNERINYLEFENICYSEEVETVKMLHIGQPISIKNSLKLLGSGYYGDPDKPEGVVYRCERENKVEFLAKYVRPDKEDGKYMKDEIYNEGWNDGRL